MLLKCIGMLEYGIDFEIENMVYVMVKINLNKGVVMKFFDVVEVCQMCGIQDVFEIINGVVVIVNNIWCVIKVVNMIFFEWEKLNYLLEQVEYWVVLEEVIGKVEYLNVEVCEVGDVEIVEGIEVKGDYCFFYVVYVLLELLIVMIFVIDDCVDIWIGY